MRRRRVVLVLASAVASAVLPLTAADAAAPAKAGWWNVAAFGGAALPMPTTAAGDLHVGQGPSGPTAIAAVAYPVPAAVTAATLDLKVTSGRTAGTPALQACPTKDDRWKPAQDGPITDAPAYDCGRASVTGLVAADGGTVTFLLTAAQLNAGAFSLAIVPVSGSQPFQLDLTKPGAQSLTTSGSAAPVAPAGAASGSTGAAPAPAVAPATGAAAPPPAAPAGGTAVGLNPAAPSLVAPSTPVLAAPVAPAPQSAPAVAGPAAPLAAALPVRPLSNRDRYVAGTLLALIAGALVWAMQQPGSTPRLLGGVARLSAPAAGAGAAAAMAAGPPRGIGRFAAVRTAPARRLV